MRDEPIVDPTDNANSSADDRSSSAEQSERPRPSAWLTIDADTQIASLLRECGVCQSGEEIVAIERAGEGNMNLTLRVRTTSQTVIVKQSRPWVEKYPQISAPVERVLQELLFYETAGTDSQLAAHMPKLLGSCSDQYVIVLQCLGQANDGSSLYRQHHADAALNKLLPDLVNWLEQLHRIVIPADRITEFSNRPLRELNHQHIFVIPFSEQPALNLDQVTPGLANLAQPLAHDTRLTSRLKQLGNLYLCDRPNLIHGDFFPGSWLVSNGQVYVIDPEFSHGGMPEFDLGVLVAHGRLISADDSPDVLTRIRSLYRETSRAIDWKLVDQFAAVEVLRRLLGVAQLPLALELRQKAQHVEAAANVLSA
ncbi:MAG: phosphotransferase [Planctomycetota bacterium]